MANLRSTPNKPRLRPNPIEPGHREHQLASGNKRRLRMPTVIRRLRVHLDSGNKIEAVKQAKKGAGYSLSEALRLVQHWEGYDWCRARSITGSGLANPMRRAAHKRRNL